VDLSDAELEQHAAADRREFDPLVQVETATWSSAGQLDWWVKDRQEWWGRVRGQTTVNVWVRLLIFVRRAAQAETAVRRRASAYRGRPSPRD
jgi:hypothetical protein